MASPVVPLLTSNLKAWFSAKGFWMVALAALVPVGLTGAWVATHTSDVAVESLTVDRMPQVDGDVANFTAVFKNVGDEPVRDFNVTLVIYRDVVTLQDTQLVHQLVSRATSGGAQETKFVDLLAPGETVSVSVKWTARPGIFIALAQADSSDDLAEIEEFNNIAQLNLEGPQVVPFTIRHKTPAPEETPALSRHLGGNASAGATVDVQVTDLQWAPADVYLGRPVILTATVTNVGEHNLTNATAIIHVGKPFGGEIRTSIPYVTQVEGFSLGAGQSTTLLLEQAWPAQEGVFWAEAYVDVGQGARDTHPANNRAVRALVVHPVLFPGLVEGLEREFKPYLEPKPEATIRAFYGNVIEMLHLRILVPLIALFYAGGVLADERERGTLAYLLTRPMPRWLIPLTKFAASFAVASVAVTIGVTAAFALLFGTPEGNLSFLTAPLFVSLVALFAYGALFTLLGVLFDRPYLVGVAFVLGWETVASFFIAAVDRLTVKHYLVEAFQAWRLGEGVTLLPEGEDAVRALVYVLTAGAAFLAAASLAMKRREFEV